MSAYPVAANYLLALFQPKDLIAFMMLKGDKVSHRFTTAETAATEEYLAELVKLNETGHSIYVAMNPLKAKRRVKENVAAIRTLYVDVDSDGEAVMSQIYGSTNTPRPNFTLQTSPGKYQFIWLVDDVAVTEQEDMLKGLIGQFHTDPAASDVVRVLRLPGFANCKYDSKPVVEIVDQYEDPLNLGHMPRFKPTDFKLLPSNGNGNGFKTPVDASLKGAPIPYGEHDSTLNKIAGKLRSLELEEEAIYNALVEIVENRCVNYGDDYLKMCRKHARYAASKPAGVTPTGKPKLGDGSVAGTEGQATLSVKEAAKAALLAAYNWETATPFTSIPEVHQEWIIPDLLMKGESTMMTGNFGSFKSYMSYFFADAISNGKEFAKRLAQKHPVLVLDRENSAATVSLRRYLVGDLRDSDDVRIFGRFTEPRAPEITNPGVLEICRTVHPLVIIDSAQDFHPGKKENDQDDMTQFSLEVNALIDAGAVGVLLLHHVAKADGSDYRGSTAIPGGVGGALKVEKKSGTRVVITGFKTRDSDDACVELKLVFPSEEAAKNKSGRVTYQVISTGKDPKQAQIERIMDFVAQNPGASKKAVEAHVGGRSEDVRGAVELLVAYKRLAIQGKGPKSGLHVMKEGEILQHETSTEIVKTLPY